MLHTVSASQRILPCTQPAVIGSDASGAGRASVGNGPEEEEGTVSSGRSVASGAVAASRREVAPPMAKGRAVPVGRTPVAVPRMPVGRATWMG